MEKSVLIIGKGKVGDATAQSLTGIKSFHDPYKGFHVNDFNNYDVAIVCVDTLRQSTNDHQALDDVLSSLQFSKFKGIVAIRCTVNPKYIEYINDHYSLNVVMFPEFMRQTDDLKMDTPWIVVLGGEKEYTDYMKQFLIEKEYCKDESMYHQVSAIDSAIIKLCQNAGLATKVIFYNMVNELCEKFGANYNAVRVGVGADKRVGIEYSIVPSPDDGLKGFKGHCLPKDVSCLASVETDHGFFTKLLEINSKLGR